MITNDRIRSGAFAGAVVVAICAAAWLLSNRSTGEPVPANPGVGGPRAGSDDQSGDLAAAAAEALVRQQLADTAPSDAQEVPTQHRRGPDTRQVAVVVDAATRSPVPGAVIEFHTTPLVGALWHRDTLFERQPIAVSVAESDGSVWLPNTLRGVLHAEVVGLEHHSVDFARVLLPGGEVEPVLLEATLGGRIVGRVLTRSFEPVSPARVLAVPAAAATIDMMRGGHPVLRTAIVSGDGTYALDGLPAGRGWRVAALDGTFSPTTSAPIEVRPGEVAATDIIVGASRTLLGRVFDPQGRPVSRAEVSYVTKPPSGLAGFDLVARYTTPHRQTQTDETGRFALTGVPAEPAQIWATHPELGASERQPLDLQAERLDPVTLVLDTNAGLRGHVVDESGSPVSGATLTWLGPKNRRQPLPQEERMSAQADTNGEFWLPLPGREETQQGYVLASARGFAPSIKSVEVPSKDATELVLRAGRSISGVVTSRASGEPVREFTVTLDAPPALRGLGRRARNEHTYLYRSERGEFRTPAEFAGSIQLSVEADGYDSLSLELNLDEAGSDGLEIQLDPTLALRGMVVDENDKPIAGAEVMASRWLLTGIFSINDSSDARSAKTDAAGRFELAAVRPSEDKYLSVTCDGYVPHQNQRVRPEAGNYSEQRVVLRRSGSIGGRVTDSRGAACAGHEVVAIATGGSGAVHRATTDEAGGYQIDQLDPNPVWNLSVLVPDAAFDLQQIFAGTDSKVVKVSAGRIERVDLVFSGAGDAVLTGRVARSSGTPVAGAQVTLVDGAARDGFGLVGSYRTNADDDGRFAFQRVRAGDYEIVFGFHTGIERNVAEVGRQRVTISADQVEYIDLVLHDGELSGQVIDAATGAPIPGAQLLLSLTGPPTTAPHNAMLRRLSSRQSDPTGRFVFRALPPASYQLLALPPPGVSEIAAKSAGPFDLGSGQVVPPVSIQLDAGTLLRVVISDALGPVEGATLLLVNADGRGLSPATVSDEHGVLETMEVRPGRWVLRARLGDRVSDSCAVEIPASGMAQVDVLIPR